MKTIKLYLLLFLTVFGLNLLSFTKINSYENNTTSIFKNDTNDTIVWKNSRKSMDDDSKRLFELYDINEESAMYADNVYIQEDSVFFDEKIPSHLAAEIPNVESYNLEFGPDGFLHNKGYIYFITKAYQYGFYDGNILYKIEVTTEQKKSFFMSLNDILLIEHSSSAVVFNKPSVTPTGKREVPYEVRSYDPGIKPYTGVDITYTSPNYNYKEAGVVFEYKAQDTTFTEPNGVVISGMTKFTSSHYLLATDTFTIQPTYVHNLGLLDPKLSIKFDKITLTITINDLKTDVMVGKTMTLPGKNDLVETHLLTLSSSEFGFEPQYFYDEKELSVAKDGWNINTTRLRCGFIENEYIVLSPNKLNAGDAYLEFQFDRQVYLFETRICLWSSKEYIGNESGDYVLIEYKDKNGKWLEYSNILDSTLPIDRNKPKYFEVSIPNGTNGIRIRAHKGNHNADRNKGRICIGTVNFTNYILKGEI